MTVTELAALDDEGLRTFLDPADAGVDPQLLGRALQDAPARMAKRVIDALPETTRQVAGDAWVATTGADSRRDAWHETLAVLFWPLLYWNHPLEYLELIEGEAIEPALLQQLPLDGAVVCDIGAGAGRFTLHAAARAARVVAVDAVPPLLAILQQRLQRMQLHNVDIRRGAFAALPIDDASVDLAVACSAFMTGGPHGGDAALREAERITRPGGSVAVVWPQDAAWFEERGYERIAVSGDAVRHFATPEAALRLCERFYGDDAAQWVRSNRTADVPYAVLGLSLIHI